MTIAAFPLSRLVDPLLVLLAVLGGGLWFWGRARSGGARRARLGRAAAWGAWAALWALSTPWASSCVARAASIKPRDIGPELSGTPPEQRVLLVLSAGMRPDEDGTPAMERVSPSGMGRCIGAARIFHTYGFGKVIVSGRHPTLARDELAGGMADLLAALGVPRDRMVLELDALNTKQNALYSARMARALGATRVVVVTSALHMRRAVRMFERAGLGVIPAPVQLEPPPPPWPDRLLPSSRALARSHRAAHELVGLLQP